MGLESDLISTRSPSSNTNIIFLNLLKEKKVHTDWATFLRMNAFYNIDMGQ